MEPPTWSYSRTWEADPLHVAQARAFVSECLRTHGLDGIVDSAQLVVSELATNAVLHTGMPFTVTLRRLDELVLLLVSDRSEVSPLPQPVRSLPTSGMGLQVVGAVSESWGVQPEPAGGKSVWATFELVAPAAGLPLSGGDGYQLGPFDL